jgi:general secretion pathway protein A
VTTSLTACEEFHGLRARPFSLTPDLRFTYHSRSHTNALEQISQALKRREGLVVVTGEVGTGKTMLCRALLETFETRTFLSVILDPLLTVEDLLHQVLTDFGLMSAREHHAPLKPLSEVARHDLVTTLQKFLASLVPLNAHAVIMIDEAQHLTGPVLEQVRLLSNFETDSAKLLQIVLVGQPNLDILLQRPDMRQLNQRVARRCELEPLTETEVRDYVERRLLVATENPPSERRTTETKTETAEQGRTPVHFTPSALQAVATISRGIPRLVNTLCDRALEASFEQREHVVDRKAVLLGAERLRLPVPARQRMSRAGLVAAAAVVLLAAGAGGWWWTHRAAPAASSMSTPVPAAIAPPPPTPSASSASPLDAPVPAPVPDTAPTTSATPPAAPSSAATAAPAAVTPPPTAAGYEITAASFKTEERATAVADALAKSGLPVAARLDATGQWYRVVVGPFATSEDAKAAQQKLEADGFPGTRILFSGKP